MQSRKSLLILIAQPAYETLMFFEGINRLRQNFNIDLLCLTFTAASQQGKELLRVAAGLGVSVSFQNAKDQGANSLLLNVEKKVLSVLQNSNYSAVITHPPHEDGSAHPYHVQCFHITRRLCARLNIAFGFFSDHEIESVEVSKNVHRLDLRKQFYLFSNYLKFHLRICKYPLKNLAEIKAEFCYFLKTLFNRRQYALFLYYPNMFEKQSMLDKYKSQLNTLISFKSYLKSVEYLYLEQYPNSSLLDSLKGSN
jgi:LmbE family N-acetylglucosaminyl deacetylase